MGPESPGSVRTRDGNWFDWCLRVRYAETDAQRIVHHAEYLVYMEEARCELVRALGLSYRTLEERGLSLVVTAAQLRYSSPAEFDDRLRVRARISRVRSREVVFEYRIEHVESGRLVARGTTTHVFVDRDLKVITGPEWIMDGLLAEPSGVDAAGRAGGAQ